MEKRISVGRAEDARARTRAKDISSTGLFSKALSIAMSIVLVVGLCPSMALAQGSGVAEHSPDSIEQIAGEAAPVAELDQVELDADAQEEGSPLAAQEQERVVPQATSEAKLVGITDTATIANDSLNITFSNVNLNWYEKNASIGRSIDGWWVGGVITAPSSVTADTLNKVQYSNDNGTTWKSFASAKDGQDAEGRYFMQFWVPVIDTTAADFIDKGYNAMSWVYKFAWDGETTSDAVDVMRVSVDLSNVVLNNKDKTGVQFKTENGAVTTKGGAAAYGVTVENGTADKKYANAGETVTVKAAAPEGDKLFASWASDPAVTFAAASQDSTTFTMPSSAVKATANFVDATAKNTTTGVCYATLAEAVAAAKANESISLLSGSTETAKVAATVDGLTVDLGGHTVATAVAEGFTASSGGAMTITNGTIEATGDDVITADGGSITLGANLNVNGATSALYAHNQGKITIDGAAVVGKSKYTTAFATGAGSAIDVKSGSLTGPNGNHVVLSVKAGATSVISGGTVSSPASSTVFAGGAGSVITISGEAVVETTVTSPAFCAGYSNGGGKIAMTGGTVRAAKGSGLVATNSAFVDVSEGTIETPGNFAVLAHEGNASVTISGGTINGFAGAGSSNNGSNNKLTISGGTITKGVQALAYEKSSANSVSITGGAVVGSLLAQNGSTLVVSGGVFGKDPTAYLGAGLAAGANVDSATKDACPYMVKTSLADAVVADSSKPYTGEAVACEGKVTLNSTELSTDDYELEYYLRSGESGSYQYEKIEPTQVINADDYWVKVAAKDTSATYGGKSSAYSKFSVTPASIKDVAFTVNSPKDTDDSLEAVLDGEFPEGTKLVEGKDFDVKYAVDSSAADAGTLDSNGKPSTAGNYVLTVTGKGNLGESIEIGFVVTTEKKVDPTTGVAVDTETLTEGTGTVVDEDSDTSTTTSIEVDVKAAGGTTDSDLDTFATGQSATEVDALKTAVHGIPATAVAGSTKIFSVDIIKKEVTKSTDPSSTTTTEKDTPLTENLNNLSLTFPLNPTTSGEFDGMRAIVMQLHASNFDDSGKAQTVTSIEHKVYVEHDAVTLTGLTQLSNFVIYVQSVDKDDLEAAIDDANDLNDSVTQTGVLPSSFDKGTQFVTPAVRAEFEAAIALAEGVLNDDAATQVQIDDACAALEEAMDAFEDAIRTGTKPTTARVSMFRLYNPNSGEHFYTANRAERNMLASVGWRYEGIGWVAPAESSVPVYRLYNPNAGDHHYTMSMGERDSLIKAGWRDEGTGWYSDEDEGTALYRQYNPNAKAGSHNYTTNKAENDMLVRAGWKAEGIGWYGVVQ